jgi:hypothetical protein
LEDTRILITCQGVSQFIAGYLACKWNNRFNNQISIDVLVYDTFSSIEVDLEIFNSVKDISKTLGIDKVYFLSQKETYNMVGMKFSNRIKFVKEKFENIDYKEVYMSRDIMGNGNLYILNLFKSTNIIGYGDSFGLIGLKESYGSGGIIKYRISNTIKILIKYLLYSFPLKYEKIKKYILTIPIIYSKKHFIKIEIVESDFAIKLMKDIAELLSNKILDNKEYDIYLLSNFTGCGWASFDNEIDLYEQIIRNNSIIKSNIIIKKHPRSSNDILESLIKRLSDDYRINKNKLINLKLPFEISGVHNLNKSKVYSIFSTCSYSLNFFYQKEVFFPLNDGLVKRFCNSKFHKVIISENENNKLVYSKILKFIKNNEICNLLS